ncbi:MAG: ATP-dependent DNA helicase RecG, partial [Flavobacteriaceae bacterium]|nr:ATP-dependent DNA helicase RecG [Flavobacteriaceae bacterium]
MNLQTSIAYLKGVGSVRAELLNKELGIFTVADLANFFPNRYIDRTRFFKINQLQPNNSDVQVVGKITSFKTVKQKRGSRLVAKFVDETGSMDLIWFRGVKWIKDLVKVNVPYVIFGKANFYNGFFSMPHPEMELVSEYKRSLRTVMQPVYPSTEKLQNKGITNRVMQK